MRKVGEMGMIDREKVIKGLDCCSSLDNNCADCPYNYDGDMSENECLRLKLIPDALALLKEQAAEIDSLNAALDNITQMGHY